MAANPDLSRGDEYHHPDGAVEIVLTIDEGRVVTISEYGSIDHSRKIVSGPSCRGFDDAVAGLPWIPVFAERTPDEQPDSRSDGA